MIYDVGDYVVDQYGDVCLITNIADTATAEYFISWFNDDWSKILSSYVKNSWTRNVKRMAKPEEIMLAKLNGLTL